MLSFVWGALGLMSLLCAIRRALRRKLQSCFAVSPQYTDPDMRLLQRILILICSDYKKKIIPIHGNFVDRFCLQHHEIDRSLTLLSVSSCWASCYSICTSSDSAAAEYYLFGTSSEPSCQYVSLGNILRLSVDC